MASKSFDAVVIGAGLGGLTAAALLAKAGRSVCVLERNHSFGGAASAFRIGALTIEASLHQTADPRDPRDPKHAILRSLGILDDVTWVPIAPFYGIEGGPVGPTFELPVGFAAAHDALTRRCPASAHGIERVLGRVQSVHDGLADLLEARDRHAAGRGLRGLLRLRSLMTTWRSSLADVFARDLGDDEVAKLCLAGNLSYYAADPRRLWWPFFAVAQGGFLASGGVYIKGGSRALVVKLAKVVKDAGGSVLLGRLAARLETDADGRPVAVHHTDAKSGTGPERIACRSVLANAAPAQLAEMLDAAQGERFESPYVGRPLSTSLFSAHFGLDAPPSRFGLARYSTIQLPDWLNSLDDFAKAGGLMERAPAGRLPVLGIANYDAIDNGLGDGLRLVSVVGADRLANWDGLTPDAERDRRARWLDAILEALEIRYPGFGGAVREKTFLNARSMHSFLHTPAGAVYGFEPLPPGAGRSSRQSRTPKTPLPGLYLASSFGGSGGFTGAMMAGADAARLALAD